MLSGDDAGCCDDIAALAPHDDVPRLRIEFILIEGVIDLGGE